MLRNLSKSFILHKKYKYSLMTNMKLHTSKSQLEKDVNKLQSVDKNHINMNDILNKFTEEEKKKILNIVNNYNLNELLDYNISKGRANKLLVWRMRNGLLKDVSDILTIDGFGLKVAEKFYQSLLQDPKIPVLKMGKSGKARTAPFVIPPLGADQRDLIKSCVSLRIGVNSITWARLKVPGNDINATCELTDWEHHEISEKKLHINDLVQRCLYVNHLIPMADCYVFENPQMAQASNIPGSVEQQNINIQKAQVTAIMGFSLTSRNTALKDLVQFENDTKANYLPNVFYLRRFLAARLFNHLVGTERVSSEESVLNLMRTYYNTNEMYDDITLESGHTEKENHRNMQVKKINLSTCVQFPNELRQMFSKSPRYFREFLGQALLLNLSFVRLVLLQDAESIALVTRVNKHANALNNQV